jgi:prolycopene isomerase
MHCACMQIFNSLNSMELKSLEEIRFLMSQFFKQPLSCLTLATYFVTNTGSTARKHISDPELLRVIDIECFCWSTVLADATPLINAGMVLCDRFWGGINYPKGGVGGISRELVTGLEVRRCFEQYLLKEIRHHFKPDLIGLIFSVPHDIC